MSDYEIHEDQVLGEGGMGTVCRGRQISLDRPVAIKIIRNDMVDTPTFVERFRREAELLGQVIDGHVVQIFGAGEWKGRQFYAMEFVEGEDLASCLKRGQEFSIEDILRIARGVGSALKAAWKYRIVHRDIKPSNILITPDNHVKVADFGLARSLSHGPSQTMTIAGTAKYLSPEQGMGDAIDVRSDIYSLGVVLFELVTRRAPFEGDSPTSVIYSHVHAQPPSVKEFAPSVRDDVAALIMTCLAKKPADRFQTPDELLEAVDEISAQINPTNGGKPRTRTLRTPQSRRGLLVASGVASAAVVAAATFISLSLFSGHPGRDEQHRRTIDLALGLGNYEEAVELAKTHFGPDSKEYQTARQAYRDAKVKEWEGRAREQASKLAWKETIRAYEVMLEFADPQRTQLINVALAFFRDLATAEEREAAGQWAQALEIYQRLQPASRELGDYVLQSIQRVRDEMQKSKEAAGVAARRQAEPKILEARRLRTLASWGPALDEARLARDLLKPFGDLPPDLTALLKELERAKAAPAGFIFVPAGPFPMGSDDGPAAERPRHPAETAAFYIGTTEVTVGEYAKFLDDPKSRTHQHCHPDEPKQKDHAPAGWTPDLPRDEAVVGVDWFDAMAYVRWAGLRLPTETEWQKAASYVFDGERARKYPWGDAPDPEAKDESFLGAQRMGRGPLEWTQSLFDAYAGSEYRHADFGKGYRVLRGGILAPDEAAENSRTNFRHRANPADRDKRFGFRCVKEVE